MKLLRNLLLGTAVLLVVIFAAALVWSVRSTSDAEPVVEAYLQSSNAVSIASDRWLTFQPAGTVPEVGFIFYPGGNVDYRAYAPALFQIAERGFLVVGVKMPLNLAVLDWKQALDVIEAHPEVESWVVGGHSLGGTMAARFANRYTEQVDGLVLWAAYPADADDLTESGVGVVSIYGTLDGLAQAGEITASAALLPADTTWVPVDGGNHAQFGFYGPQQGDNPATISREEQQAQVVDATAAFLAQFEE